MSDQKADVWRDVLRRAIAACKPPVVGTNFRGAVNVAAAKHDLRFPPDDEPALRFIQLLERYPDVLSILRRPGQDFLIAPADSPNLLSERLQHGLFGIRHDLFQAFTTIAENKPYYDKASDRVIWQESATEQSSPDFIPIDPATSASEIQLRRDFASKQEEPIQTFLMKALEDPLPLQTFGRRIKESSLQIRWHSFRTERVLEKMQRWASDNKLDWKDAWLTPGRTGEGTKERHLATPPRISLTGRGPTEHDPLHLLFSGLDAADIQRISIPLDLVLKVLSAPKKP